MFGICSLTIVLYFEAWHPLRCLFDSFLSAASSSLFKSINRGIIHLKMNTLLDGNKIIISKDNFVYSEEKQRRRKRNCVCFFRRWMCDNRGLKAISGWGKFPGFVCLNVETNSGVVQTGSLAMCLTVPLKSPSRSKEGCQRGLISLWQISLFSSLFFIWIMQASSSKW